MILTDLLFCSDSVMRKQKSEPIVVRFHEKCPLRHFFIAKADIYNPLLIALRSPAGDLTDSRQIRCFERHILWFSFRIFHTQALSATANLIYCVQSLPFT